MPDVISYGCFTNKELFPHKNRGLEITYIAKGSLDWMVDGQVEPISDDSVFFTLPWQVHGSLHPQEPDNTVWHILFHLKKDYEAPQTQFGLPECLGFSAEEEKVISQTLAASHKHCFRATPAVQWLMPALIRELQGSHDLKKAHAVSLLRAVLVELKRIVRSESVSPDDTGLPEKRMERLLRELSEHSDQLWTLEQMADVCKVRRTQLNTVFKKRTGCTPMEYLTRLRIERAKTLLRVTQNKVIDIAFGCGFGSSQYFANVFRSATGMTPSEYRRHCSGLTAKEIRKWKDVGFRSVQEEYRRVEDFSKNK